jgi:hypothetical protein
MRSPRWTTQCRRRKLRRNPERYHSLSSCKCTFVARPLIRGSHAERRGSITASHRSISRRPSAARQSTTRRAPKPNRQSHLPRPTALRRRTVRAPAAVPITERIALICPQILRQSVPKVVLITAIGIASGSRTAAQRSHRSRRFRQYLNAPFPHRVPASISRQTGSIKATRPVNRLRPRPDALPPVPSRLRSPLRTRRPNRCLQTSRRLNPRRPCNRRQHRRSRDRTAVPTVAPNPRSRRPDRTQVGTPKVGRR